MYKLHVTLKLNYNDFFAAIIYTRHGQIGRFVTQFSITIIQIITS